MQTMTAEAADRIAARWRADADADNPAGPLYAAGKFAEADIASPGRTFTRLSCFARTACTAQGSQCC
jgi:hypothetical protein